MNSITDRIIHQVKIDPKISAPKIAASTSNTLGRSVSTETVRRVLRKAGYNGRVARKKPLIGCFAFLSKGVTSDPKVVKLIKLFCVTFRNVVHPIKEFAAMAEKVLPRSIGVKRYSL
ncbi:hypothetical protein TNCV_3561911 [Trichonephila clavipes]|nr:hypothetical protein TNCV_3561911 [Trichonephila clavipes]